MNGEEHHWKIMVSIVLWTIFGKGKSDIIVKPANTDVQLGDATYLNCSISESIGDVSWFHYPVGVGTKRHRYVYSHGHLEPPYDQRFRIEKRISSGTFDLILLKAELLDAGLYVCQENGKSEKAAKAELVVLETDPICVTNINGSAIIGGNKCGLEEGAIHLSCSMSYNGNIHPEMQWSRVKDNDFYPIPRALGLCHVADEAITCNYTLPSEQEIDGSFFVCQATRSRMIRHTCTTDIARVFCAVGDESLKEMSVGDEVACSVNSSRTSCTYKWIWIDGSERNVISENRVLKITNVGIHKCQASCLVNHLPCNFEAMTFESKELSNALVADLWIPLVMTNSVLAVVVIVLFLCIAKLFVRFKAKRSQAYGNRDLENEEKCLLSGQEETRADLVEDHQHLNEEDNRLKEPLDRKIIIAETNNLNKRKVALSGHSLPYDGREENNP